MYFIQFFVTFREIAENETRVISVLDENATVPVGTYALIESYCNDDTCDCRKVMVNIVDAQNPSRCFATIGYGWESLTYYTEWMYGDLDMAGMLVGSYLEPGGRQSEYAQPFLEIWEKIVAGDAGYVDRLKKHYRMFKEHAGDK